jgi:hypothetical protein
MTAPTPLRRRRRRCDLCDDIAWLAGTGVTHPEALAARTGRPYGSLLTHLRRHDRADLTARVAAERLSRSA